MKTPNLDRLAARSLYFLRAYVQQQVCSPSRNSYMTGRRPDRTRTWNFIDDFRVYRDPIHNGDSGSGPGNGANWTTMPGFFKAAGFNVFASGKTYHPNRPINNDMALSWTSYDQEMPGDRNMSCNGGKPNVQQGGVNNSWHWIVDCEENDGEVLLSKAAVMHIKWATAAANRSRPFFIAMGHHRPHLPWVVPKRFFQQYGDPLHTRIAAVQEYPSTAAKIQWHPWFSQVFPKDVDTSQHTRRVAYYAACSYFDEHVGWVLDALDASGAAEDTVIMLIGDHGWHLGERNMWEKKGLDELDTHIPLLISVPWMKSASSGLTTSALAEAVDLMPTMIELSGMPPCDDPCVIAGTEPAGPSGLQGVSLVPALKQPLQNGTLKPFAFSQFPRCACTYDNNVVDTRNGTCPGLYSNNFTTESGSTGAANHHVCLFTPSSDFDWMGYSIRSDTHRYTIFVAWHGKSLQPLWNEVWAEELYDHSNDDGTDVSYISCPPLVNRSHARFS